MKRGILIVIAASFLAAAIDVAPSFAKKATKTAPKTQQQPSTGYIMGQVKAKEKFWELEVDNCIVGYIQGFNPCNATIDLPRGQLTIKCFYKVKTIPVGDISLADVAKWGTGKSYTIKASIVNDNTHKSLKEEKTKKLPQFTWADVQQWKSSGQGDNPKEWNEMLYFTWQATPEYSGANAFSFVLDTANVIPEYGGESNNKCSGTINIQ